MNVNIRPTKLFRLSETLTREEKVICIAAGIIPSRIYWCLGNRSSKLGGYIGQFRETYQHCLGFSPTGKQFDNMPMRYFEPIN